jgi:hypothetical protein
LPRSVPYKANVTANLKGNYILTPEQHNKYLAYSHLAFAGLFSFFIIMMFVFIAVVFPILTQNDPHPPPAGLFLVMGLFMSVIYGAMTLPSYIAGYALLKKKSWAKTASIIAGVFDCMHFPFGAAVAIYTFWFLFSDPGKYLYDRPAYSLPPGQQAWANETSAYNERQYTPRSTPPDWR